VQPDEALTSYVFREDQIVRVTNTIHHSRLVPRRNHKNERLEVSVCRSSELTEAQVWSICSAYFDVHAEGKTTRGVSGHLSPEQGLKKLLEGTGVSYRFVDAGIPPLGNRPAPIPRERNLVSATRRSSSTIPASASTGPTPSTTAGPCDTLSRACSAIE